MSSLQVGEDIAAEGATAPRVTLNQMRGRVVSENYFTVGEAVRALGHTSHTAHDLLTLCVIVLDNGWTLLGKSAPASAANFDAAKGRTFAYEDALRQLWPLEGYRLRDYLAKEEADVA